MNFRQNSVVFYFEHIRFLSSEDKCFTGDMVIHLVV